MKFAILLFLSALPFAMLGQSESDQVGQINKAIDQAVVNKDIEALRELYAEDFRFVHGTGAVDNKESWLRSVSNINQRFISRSHDSTEVELHRDIAIVSGVLNIVRMDAEKQVRYRIWYIRVFRRAEQWQLISHRTTKEVHL